MGAPLFFCSINHLAYLCDFDCLTILTDITDNWLRDEQRNLESESDLRRQSLPPSVVLAYLLRILRRDVIVLVPRPELSNILFDPGLGEYRGPETAESMCRLSRLLDAKLLH